MAQLPNSTSRITPKDYEVSRIQDNVTRALDAILAFLNAAFSYNSKTKVLTVAPAAVFQNGVTAQQASGIAVLKAQNTGTGTAQLSLDTSTRRWNIVSDGNGNLAFNDDTLNLNRAYFAQNGNFISQASVVAVALSTVNAGNSALQWGAGAPAFTAAKGSIFMRTDGGAGTTMYINETGTNVWRAV